LRTKVRRATCRTPEGVVCSFAQEADMEEVSTVFVGLDAHAQSTAIAVAHVGREPARFVGTVGARLSELISRWSCTSWHGARGFVDRTRGRWQGKCR